MERRHTNRREADLSTISAPMSLPDVRELFGREAQLLWDVANAPAVNPQDFAPTAPMMFVERITS